MCSHNTASCSSCRLPLFGTIRLQVSIRSSRLLPLRFWTVWYSLSRTTCSSLASFQGEAITHSDSGERYLSLAVTITDTSFITILKNLFWLAQCLWNLTVLSERFPPELFRHWQTGAVHRPFNYVFTNQHQIPRKASCPPYLLTFSRFQNSQLFNFDESP